MKSKLKHTRNWSGHRLTAPPPVNAQQYYFSTSISLPIHSRNEKFGALFKNIFTLLSFKNWVNLKLLTRVMQRVCAYVYVCTDLQIEHFHISRTSLIVLYCSRSLESFSTSEFNRFIERKFHYCTAHATSVVPFESIPLSHTPIKAKSSKMVHLLRVSRPNSACVSADRKVLQRDHHNVSFLTSKGMNQETHFKRI